MCDLFQASCRVCLSEDLAPPYIYLLESEVLSDTIGSVLHLQTNLFDPSLFPNHVCHTCKEVIEPFIKLQGIAVAHEKFLLKYQEKIKQFGIKNVKATLAQEDIAKANTNEEDTPLDDNLQHLEDTIHLFQNEKYLDKSLLQEDYFLINKDADTIDENDNSRNEEEAYCHICGPSRILKKSSLSNHLKTFHKEKDIDCEIAGCVVKFKKKSDMKKHVRNIHKGERSFCVQCGESFKDLHYHIKVFHENVSFPCDTCNKKYTTKQGLNFHIKHTHEESKKEVCDYCAVEVKHVKHHIKMMHSGSVEKKVSCQEETCSKKFRTKQEASIHYNAAHLNKKEMCPLCGGWYKNLYTHIHQTHQSEKKHVCDQCGKAFGKKNDLKVHKERIHLLMRYICPECGKTISKIREHLKTVHNVTSVNMAEIENVKYDASAQENTTKTEHQIKPYDLGPNSSQTGTVSIPMDTKEGITLAMLSQHHGWSL